MDVLSHIGVQYTTIQSHLFGGQADARLIYQDARGHHHQARRFISRLRTWHKDFQVHLLLESRFIKR